MDDVLVVADKHSWLTYWEGRKITFEESNPELLAGYRIVVLAPGDSKYQASCERIFEWKIAGLLGEAKLFLSTYKGRHLWTPERDALVERWAVHARSEREALDSERLYFIPLCVMPPRKELVAGDDGYLFVGGRKWRRLDVGVEAMSRSGYPGRVISDFAPAGDFPNVEIHREKIPKKDYIDVMERARVVLVPLHGTPVSHGHVDVITAISVGKPVIVTAGASCDDYVKHGVNGLLVPDNSVEAWVDAIHEAWERADEFAAAAREMAPLYDSAQYSRHVRDMITTPDRQRVLPEAGAVDPRRDRSEWVFSQQKIVHQKAVRLANELLRERRYAEALAQAENCLDGAFRSTALRIKMRAQIRLRPETAEEVIREILAETPDDAEARADLASSLLAQKRMDEALEEARKAVELDPARSASRAVLALALSRAGQGDEAERVIDDGLAADPDDARLLRMKTKLTGRAAR